MERALFTLLAAAVGSVRQPHGVIWYRVLATHQPFDAQLVDDLVGILAPTPSPINATGHGSTIKIQTTGRGA